MKNQLYTFFLDYKGGTYVSQVKAPSAIHALTAWAEALDYTKVDGLSSSANKDLIEQIDQPTRLEGIRNTWCHSALLSRHLALIHLTKTKE